MAASPQIPLGLEVPRVTCASQGLVDVHYASAVLGLDFESVADKVNRFTKPGAQPAGLCWVFNIAVDPKGAEAANRFWPQELYSFRHPALLKQLQSKLTPSVLAAVLPATPPM